MGLLLACAQFILIAIICVQEVRRKSPALFLWATLMIMFGIMHLLCVFTGNSDYKDKTLNQASLFVMGFCFLYILTRNVLWLSESKKHPVISYNAFENKDDKIVSPLVILFIIIAFIMCYRAISISGGILNSSWGAGRNYAATLDYTNGRQLYSILYFSLSGLPLFLWIKKQRKLSILCLIMILMVTVLTRNRVLILPFLFFLLSLYILRIKRLQIKHLFFAIIAAIFVIYIVYGLRVFRHYGTIQMFLSDFNTADFFNKINIHLATDNGELGLRNAFYYFVQQDNKFYGFGEMATYIRMLLVYIPTRFSFGFKPDDFALTMGAAIGMAQGGSMHPTLFGDCYANAGYWGIFLGIFWAIYSYFADKIVVHCKSQVLKTLLYCLFSVTFVIIGRGSVYNSFFFVAWGIPILWIIITIFRKLPNIKFKLN